MLVVVDSFFVVVCLHLRCEEHFMFWCKNVAFSENLFPEYSILDNTGLNESV